MNAQAGHLFAPTAEGCPVCGDQDCHVPYPEHVQDYPFLPGGVDPMAGKDFVIAPHKVYDHEREVIAYGTGDRVPIEEARRLGLVDDKPAKAKPADQPAAKRGARRARTGPAEDRARKPAEDR